jgi:hypothetical protein
MTYQQTSPPPPVPSPYRNTTRFIVAIVLLVTLLGAGCIGLLVTAGTKSVSAARPAADRFLRLIENDDYAGAQQMLATGTRGTTTEDSLSDVMTVLEKRRGKARSHTGPNGFNIRSFNGVTQVEMGYDEVFENGHTPVDLVLTPERGQWKVVSFNFKL